jgi:hypothetical protein
MLHLPAVRNARQMTFAPCICSLLTSATLCPAAQVYANDGTASKPKWGYVATIPGAVMKVGGNWVSAFSQNALWAYSGPHSL